MNILLALIGIFSVRYGIYIPMLLEKIENHTKPQKVKIIVTCLMLFCVIIIEVEGCFNY